MLLAAYLLGGLPDVRVCGDDLPYVKLARLVFGADRVQHAAQRVMTHMRSMGYSSDKEDKSTARLRWLSGILSIPRSGSGRFRRGIGGHISLHFANPVVSADQVSALFL